jgi:hypothetical protein
MRVNYDRRGRVRGYSGGIGLYYWFQFLWLAFMLLIVIPVLVLLLAVALVCLLVAGIAALAGKPDASRSWRQAAAATVGLLGRFSARHTGP